MSVNLIDPEILSAKYCTHWAEFCCTPTQINEIPKPLVRSAKRDSTWSRVQNTHGQTFLSEKAGWFAGKCPNPALTHVQSIYRTTCMPWLQVVLTLFSHTSLFLLTSLFFLLPQHNELLRSTAGVIGANKDDSTKKLNNCKEFSLFLIFSTEWIFKMIISIAKFG